MKYTNNKQSSTDVAPYATIEIYGVQYPYKPESGEWVLQNIVNEETKQVTKQWSMVEKLPVDVRTLKIGRFQEGLGHGIREALIDWARGSAIDVPGFQAPLMGSAEIPRGSCFFDGDGFYRNEEEAAEQAEDFDGDQGHVHVHEGRVVWTKYPGTQRSEALDLIMDMPKEVALPLTQDMIEELLEKERNEEYVERIQFGKAAMENRTGLVTWEFNSKELFETLSIDGLSNKMHHLFSDPMRFQAIELDGLKGRSKDDRNTETKSYLETPINMSDKYNWLFYPNRIGSLKLNQINWVLSTDPAEIIDRALKLDLEFYELEPAEGVNGLKEPWIYDRELLGRLKKLGLVDYYELPKVREELPPAIVFWVCRPGTKFCGLTDTKRGAKFRTFCYVIPPVAKKIKGKWQIIHPITAIADRLAEFDNYIRHPEGHVVKTFPQTVNDLAKYKGKYTGLLKFIQEVCGTYGDSGPARMVQGNIVPTKMCEGTVTRTIAIDFGMTQMDVNQKWVEVQQVNEITRLCLSSGKGTNNRIRKYPLARENGTPLWAKEWDHPRRAGNQRAQLLQGIPLQGDGMMTVAIVKMRTKSQVLITPSGVPKQRTDQVFLPLVSPTLVEGFEQVEYRTKWDGQVTRSYIGDPKETREIGKLVDFHGMKFQPRRVDSAYIQTAPTENGISEVATIDLIVPIDEIAGKGCLQTWMEGAKHYKMEFQGEEWDAWVVNRMLFRTGTASENIPVRKKTMHSKGTDRLLIHTELLKLHPEMAEKEYLGLPFPDMKYGLAKIEALKAISHAIAESRPEEDYQDEQC